MLAVFSSGPHNCSPRAVQSTAADSRERLVSRMTPESADALSGPVRRRLVNRRQEADRVERVVPYQEGHYW